MISKIKRCIIDDVNARNHSFNLIIPTEYPSKHNKDYDIIIINSIQRNQAGAIWPSTMTLWSNEFNKFVINGCYADISFNNNSIHDCYVTAAFIPDDIYHNIYYHMSTPNAWHQINNLVKSNLPCKQILLQPNQSYIIELDCEFDKLLCIPFLNECSTHLNSIMPDSQIVRLITFVQSITSNGTGQSYNAHCTNSVIVQTNISIDVTLSN